MTTPVVSDLVQLRVLAARILSVANVLEGKTWSSPAEIYLMYWYAVPPEAAALLKEVFAEAKGMHELRQIAAELVSIHGRGVDLSQDIFWFRASYMRDSSSGLPILFFIRSRADVAREVYRVLLERTSTSGLKCVLDHMENYPSKYAGFRDGQRRIERELWRRVNWSALRVAWIAATVGYRTQC